MIKLQLGRCVQWHDGKQHHTGHEVQLPSGAAVQDWGERLVSSYGDLFFVEPEKLKPYDGGRPAEREKEQAEAELPTLEERLAALEQRLGDLEGCHMNVDIAQLYDRVEALERKTADPQPQPVRLKDVWQPVRLEDVWVVQWRLHDDIGGKWFSDRWISKRGAEEFIRCKRLRETHEVRGPLRCAVTVIPETEKETT